MKSLIYRYDNIGNKITCNEEGKIVTIPFLKSDPCITCMCINNEIDCFKNTCSQTINCYHYHQSNHSTNQCCRECLHCRIDSLDRVLQNGETFVDPIDPCRQLYCHVGEINWQSFFPLSLSIKSRMIFFFFSTKSLAHWRSSKLNVMCLVRNRTVWWANVVHRAMLVLEMFMMVMKSRIIPMIPVSDAIVSRDKWFVIDEFVQYFLVRFQNKFDRKILAALDVRLVAKMRFDQILSQKTLVFLVRKYIIIWNNLKRMIALNVNAR